MKTLAIIDSVPLVQQGEFEIEQIAPEQGAIRKLVGPTESAQDDGQAHEEELREVRWIEKAEQLENLMRLAQLPSFDLVIVLLTLQKHVSIEDVWRARLQRFNCSIIFVVNRDAMEWIQGRESPPVADWTWPVYVLTWESVEKTAGDLRTTIDEVKKNKEADKKRTEAKVQDGETSWEAARLQEIKAAREEDLRCRSPA